MKPIRVACFIDGFNLYHAVDDLNKNHLKWLDLKGLASAFIVPSIETLTTVNYFSAYATWKPDKFARHKIYVSALEAIGVDVILGKFKEKPRECLACGQRWIGHEEKETDVRIAIHLVAGALKKISTRFF